MQGDGKHMKKTKKQSERVYYDKQSDVLWFLIKSGVEENHKEIAPGISVELGKNGELLGIEVLNASKVLKPVLDQKGTSAQFN